MNVDQRQSTSAAARPGSQGRLAAAQPKRILTTKQKQLISAVLAFHLLAVITGPLAAPPSSELFGQLWDKMQWYVEPMFLNHGYRFFGPDPGASHLVEYEVELADGSKLTGDFPDLGDHWPRLFYHRHFMLSERLQAFPDSRQPPDALLAIGMACGLSGEGATIDLPGDPTINALARSYARHLYHKHNAKRVKLTLVRHLIPQPDWVLEEGMKLDDPSLYVRWLLADYTPEDAEFDGARQSLAQAPSGAAGVSARARLEEVQP